MSDVIVITPPDAIMTAANIKAALPALSGVDDGVVTALIATATAELDGPSGWLGRAIGRQILELQDCSFPAPGRWIVLPCPPVAAIEQVAYDGADGTEVIVDPTSYHLRGTSLAMKAGFRWPQVAGSLGAARIRYRAGYADGQVPAPILTAVQLRVGALHSALRSSPDLKKEVVEGIGSREWRVGSDGETATDKAIASLLAPFRIWGV